ncbi:hypothetical protein LCGC14_0766310 [marine sediment metagenome]|uniref:Uncharacterized protein n=1 Tax=marine sediment metagenome TaxID=412755 RepID=A0A0F9QJE8_9ZZZZ
MPEKKAEIDNQRQIMLLSNNDSTYNPLLIMIPQWAKGSLDKMPKERQYFIYDQFVHDVGLAWEKLLRES